MTQKLKKALVFAFDCAFSSHRIKCNTSTESFLWRASFLLPTLMSYEQYMRTLWPKSMKIWWLNRALWSLIHLICSKRHFWNHELFNICWPSRLMWRSNWNLLTVACNSSILVIIIIIIPSFPNRPLLAKISETASLSVTKLHTHVDPHLLSCTWYFLSGSGLPFWI